LSGTVCVANASPVPTRVTCQDGSHPSDNGTSCVRDAPDCRSGTHLDDGKCVEDGPHCGPNTHPDGSRCVDDGPQCKSGSHLEGSACVTDECPSGTHRIDGGETTCIPIPCSGEAHSTGDGDRPCG